MCHFYLQYRINKTLKLAKWKLAVYIEKFWKQLGHSDFKSFYAKSVAEVLKWNQFYFWICFNPFLKKTFKTIISLVKTQKTIDIIIQNSTSFLCWDRKTPQPPPKPARPGVAGAAGPRRPAAAAGAARNRAAGAGDAPRWRRNARRCRAASRALWWAPATALRHVAAAPFPASCCCCCRVWPIAGSTVSPTAPFVAESDLECIWMWKNHFFIKKIKQEMVFFANCKGAGGGRPPGRPFETPELVGGTNLDPDFWKNVRDKNAVFHSNKGLEKLCFRIKNYSKMSLFNVFSCKNVILPNF